VINFFFISIPQGGSDKWIGSLRIPRKKQKIETVKEVLLEVTFREKTYEKLPNLTPRLIKNDNLSYF
jgi:hypothetical protein